MADAPPSPPAGEPAPPPPSPWRARHHSVAVLVAWHMLAVLVFILPYPPYFDDRTLRTKEVQEEMALLFGTVHKVAPIWKDAQETQTRVLALVRTYMDVYFKARKPFESYLEAVGSTQSWNMFGGTPPRYPKVLMVEIKPRGEAAYAPYKDHRWGTPEHAQANFRDFKVHEVLGIGGWDRQREWYANWWARQWNAEHPDRPAEMVHFYYWQLTTPPAEAVRAGNADRQQQQVQHFHWKVPPGVGPP